MPSSSQQLQLPPLPRLTKEMIVSFLDIGSIYALAQTSRAWHLVCSSYEGVYPVLFQKHYPQGVHLDDEYSKDYLPLVTTTSPQRQHFIALENMLYASLTFHDGDTVDVAANDTTHFLRIYRRDIISLLRAVRAQEIQALKALLQRFKARHYSRNTVYRLLTVRDATMKNALFLARERHRQDMLDEIYRLFCELPAMGNNAVYLQEKLAIITDNATSLFALEELRENLELACAYSAMRFIRSFIQENDSETIITQFLDRSGISLIEIVYGLGNAAICQQIYVAVLLPLRQTVDDIRRLYRIVDILVSVAVKSGNNAAITVIREFAQGITVDLSVLMAAAIAEGRFDTASALLKFSFPDGLPSLRYLLNTSVPDNVDNRARKQFYDDLHRYVVEFFYDGSSLNFSKHDRDNYNLLFWLIYLEKISAEQVHARRLVEPDIHMARLAAIYCNNEEVFSALLRYDCQNNMGRYVQHIHRLDRHRLLEKLLQCKSVPSGLLEIFRNDPQPKCTRLLIDKAGYKRYCRQLLVGLIETFQDGTLPLHEFIDLFCQKIFLQAIATSTKSQGEIRRCIRIRKHRPTKVSLCFPLYYHSQWQAQSQEGVPLQQAATQFLQLAFPAPAGDKLGTSTFFGSSRFTVLANVVANTFVRCHTRAEIFSAVIELLKSLPMAQCGGDELLRRCRFLSVALSMEAPSELTVRPS